MLRLLLLEKYFQDIVLRQENKYIKTKRFYEIINPDKSEKYTDNFSLKKIQKEYETKELMDYSISDCIITNHRESAFEGKQGSFSGAGKFWRDFGGLKIPPLVMEQSSAGGGSSRISVDANIQV